MFAQIQIYFASQIRFLSKMLGGGCPQISCGSHPIELFSLRVMVTFQPCLLSFTGRCLLWAGAAALPVRQQGAVVTVRTQSRSPLPRGPVSCTGRGGFHCTVR